MLLDPSAFHRLCRARDLLADSSVETVSIRAAAREAGMSPFHFIRRFESLFGVTPHRFRIQRRLDLARHLLASGRLSVTETCMEVGMSSLGSFSTLFLAATGETPSGFRRRARQIVRVPEMPPTELFPGCLNLLSRLPPGSLLRPTIAISEKLRTTAAG